MNSLSHSIGSHISTRPSSSSSISKRSHRPQSYALTETLGFCIPVSLRASSTNSLRFRASFKPPASDVPLGSQLSDADEDYDYDYEDEDDVAADEYDDVSGELSDEVDQSDDDDDDEFEIPVVDDTDASTARPVESKSQRVEKLCNEVRRFGEEVIDADELASIYDFRIDKFQVKIKKNKKSVCENKAVVFFFFFFKFLMFLTFSLIEYWEEISHTSIPERFFGCGIGAYEQWEDFDSRSRGCCCRCKGEKIVLYDSAQGIVQPEVSRISVCKP